MSIQDMFNELENSVFPNDDNPIGINWQMKGFGFGQLYFYVDEDQKLHCDNECMSRDMVKKILCTMVNQAIMDDEV